MTTVSDYQKSDLGKAEQLNDYALARTLVERLKKQIMNKSGQYSTDYLADAQAALKTLERIKRYW